MRDLKADLEICEAASTGPWIKVDNGDEAMDNWLIASLGNSGEDGKDYYVTTDSVHASEFDGDAKTDAVFIAQARTGWPYAIQRALSAEVELATANAALEALQNEITDLRCQLEHCSSAATHIDMLKQENERLKDRLQISPQGDDKIDELEAAMQHLKFKNERYQKALQWIAQQPCIYPGMKCSETDMCITEYCLPCYAKQALGGGTHDNSI